MLVSPSEATLVELARERPVDVVIFEGKAPRADNGLWDCPGVERIAWIDDTGRGRFKGPRRSDWKIHRRSISHAAVGGVTDGIFSVFLASRLERDTEWIIPSAGVRTTLSRVIDPTKGGRAVDPPGEAENSTEARNTAKGLLGWKRRFGQVCVPTVYSKEKWAVRRLYDVELTDALDLPGTMRKRMNSQQLGKSSKVKVPGKVMAAVIESLLVRIVQSDQTGEGTPASSPISRESRKRKLLVAEVQVATKRANVESHAGSAIDLTEGCSERLKMEAFNLSTVVDKAVKSDDAPAPVHLFDRRVLDAFPFIIERQAVGSNGSLSWVEAMRRLRAFSLRVWKRMIRSGFVEWLKTRKGASSEMSRSMVNLGWDACRRADGASFWEWDCGSTPLFWRWPEIYQKDIWLGVPPRFVGSPPNLKEAQPPYVDLDVRAKVTAKLQKVVDRGYVEL